MCLIQVEEAQAALARKHLLQQELHDKVDAAENDKQRSEEKLAESLLEIERWKLKVTEEVNERKKVSLLATHLSET